MRGKHGHFVEHGACSLICLFPRGRNADNDVTKRIASELCEVSLAQRKGEHVGRLVFMTIDLVQLVDAIVVS